MSYTNLKWNRPIRYTVPNSLSIPNDGGIYKVLRDDGKEGSLSRIYVGKAASLRAQYNRHLSNDEENDCLKDNIKNKRCYFKYAILTGEDERKRVEDYLLKTERYECNVLGQ